MESATIPYALRLNGNMCYDNWLILLGMIDKWNHSIIAFIPEKMISCAVSWVSASA
jgi:hypothetical protein